MASNRRSNSRYKTLAITRFDHNHGYEYSFVDQPHHRYECIICHLPSRNPQMTGECCRGQVICKSCLDMAKNFGPNSCPFCRKEGFSTFPNFQLDREIKSLHVYCTNKQKGCEWQGELNNINDHINLGNRDGCQFQEVQCSNNCGKTIERRHLTAHEGTECPRRIINCQYCHSETMADQKMQLLHMSQCPKFPISCPNKCQVGTILREDMEKHKEECQLEVIACSNQCGSKFIRQNLSNHVQTACPRRKVICQYCHDTGEHQFITDKQHKDKCPKFPLLCPNWCRIGVVPREKFKAHKKECPLEIIRCEYHMVGCGVTLVRKDREKHKKNKMEDHLMMVTRKLSKLDDTQQELTNTKGELANVKESLNTTRVELARVKQELAGMCTKHELRNTNAELAQLKHSLNDTKYQLATMSKQITNLMVFVHTQLKSSVAARATDIVSEAKPSLKLNAMVTMCEFGDQVCPVLLKMPQFSKKRRDKASWNSNPFYTHNHGYKMYLTVDVDGETHISLSLYIMKGPYDDQLKWPLHEKIEIKLMNQISNSNHHSKTVMIIYDGQNRASREQLILARYPISQFISNKDLGMTTTTHQFIKDDCVFFQVTKL